MLAHHAAAAIAGTMLFFTVAVAPTIFRVLTPAINRATDVGARHRFAGLHGASVVLNLAQPASLAWGLWALAP